MDQDLWMKALHFHGPVLLQTVLGDIPEIKGEVENEKLAMCRFIKNKLDMLFKPSESTSDHPTDPSLPLVPIEIFRNVSPIDRRDLFYKSLDRGNILLLQVINDTLPDDYKLLVLCKHDCVMKLDDLSLIMYLPKLQEELNLAGGKLESNDLIRAAVCSCNIDNRKLNVTLDSNFLDDENVKLGKISESDLPSYIGNVDFGSSYVEYLHNSNAFKNPNWSEELYTVLNLKKTHLYSFFDGLEGKIYPDKEYGSELKKKQNLGLSNGQYSKALKYSVSGNFTDAFLYLNNALKLYPANVEALVTRGTLYANTNNLRKAFVDMEEALKIDPDHEGAHKQMSILLVAAARMHIEKNDFEKAQESLDAALHLDSNNQGAILAVDEIRQKKISGSAGSLEKAVKMFDKKVRIGSSSSESSSSRKEDREKSTLDAHTKAFLSSLKKTRLHIDKKSRHHHSHHTTASSSSSSSKSPKKCITID